MEFDSSGVRQRNIGYRSRERN